MLHPELAVFSNTHLGAKCVADRAWSKVVWRIFTLWTNSFIHSNQILKKRQVEKKRVSILKINLIIGICEKCVANQACSKVVFLQFESTLIWFRYLSRILISEHLKPCMHILKVSISSLNHVIDRLTKTPKLAEKKCAQFYHLRCLKNWSGQKMPITRYVSLNWYSSMKKLERFG